MKDGIDDMSVTFCGHGDIHYGDDTRKRLYDEIKKQIINGEYEFLLGGYGSFDLLAAHTLKSIKEKYTHIKSLLVIPYLDKEYDTELYDGTIYPPLESVPKRYAIVKRNEWIIDNSDTLIAYVLHDWGGAWNTLKYAVKKKKCVINIAYGHLEAQN